MQRLKPFASALAALILTATAQAGPVSGQGTWETTLHARDINGDMTVDAYYDSTLDLTWLADWNANGAHNWLGQVAWAAALNVHGVTGWRLPSTTDSNNDGCNFSFAGGTDCGYNVATSSSEMAHMFYVTLGNLSFCPPGDGSCAGGPQAGFGLSNTADFINMQSDFYWSGTENAPGNGNAWQFITQSGYQDVTGTDDRLFAVAVRLGDVIDGPTVPAPQSLGLLLAAIGMLAVLRRRRASAL